MNLETVGEWKSLEGLKSLKWKQVPAPDAPAEAPLVPLPILFAWRMARSSRRELEWAWHGKLIGAKIQVLAHWLETGRARCKGRGRTRATCAVRKSDSKVLRNAKHSTTPLITITRIISLPLSPVFSGPRVQALVQRKVPVPPYTRFLPQAL